MENDDDDAKTVFQTVVDSLKIRAREGYKILNSKDYYDCCLSPKCDKTQHPPFIHGNGSIKKKLTNDLTKSLLNPPKLSGKNMSKKTYSGQDEQKLRTGAQSRKTAGKDFEENPKMEKHSFSQNHKQLEENKITKRLHAPCHSTEQSSPRSRKSTKSRSKAEEDMPLHSSPYNSPEHSSHRSNRPTKYRYREESPSPPRRTRSPDRPSPNERNKTRRGLHRKRDFRNSSRERLQLYNEDSDEESKKYNDGSVERDERYFSKNDDHCRRHNNSNVGRHKNSSDMGHAKRASSPRNRIQNKSHKPTCNDEDEEDEEAEFSKKKYTSPRHHSRSASPKERSKYRSSSSKRFSNSSPPHKHDVEIERDQKSHRRVSLDRSRCDDKSDRPSPKKNKNRLPSGENHGPTRKYSETLRKEFNNVLTAMNSDDNLDEKMTSKSANKNTKKGHEPKENKIEKHKSEYDNCKKNPRYDDRSNKKKNFRAEDNEFDHSSRDYKKPLGPNRKYSEAFQKEIAALKMELHNNDNHSEEMESAKSFRSSTPRRRNYSDDELPNHSNKSDKFKERKFTEEKRSTMARQPIRKTQIRRKMSESESELSDNDDETETVFKEEKHELRQQSSSEAETDLGNNTESVQSESSSTNIENRSNSNENNLSEESEQEYSFRNDKSHPRLSLSCTSEEMHRKIKNSRCCYAGDRNRTATSRTANNLKYKLPERLTY